MQSQHNTELALSEEYTLNTLIYFEHHIYVAGCKVTARSWEQKYLVGCYKSVIFQVVHTLYVPSHITVNSHRLGQMGYSGQEIVSFLYLMTLSISQPIKHWRERLIMNYQLERIQKAVAMI